MPTNVSKSVPEEVLHRQKRQGEHGGRDRNDVATGQGIPASKKLEEAKHSLSSRTSGGSAILLTF